MDINYATKYATKIAERFHLKSITDDDCGNEYSWLAPGSKTIKVSSVDTVPETQYQRSGDARFGETYDVGDTLQEMTCTQQPAFSFTIDKLDGSDQAIEKSASKSLRRQLDEVTIPGIDKYRIKKWAMGANILLAAGTAPNRETIGEQVMTLNTMMSNALVPMDNRTLYIARTQYQNLKLNKDWISIDTLGREAMKKGVVGEFDGCRVKPVPDSYMPKGVYFFIKRKGSTVDPVKMAQYDILPKVKGYSGPVVQGVTYHDAFVLGAKGDGIAMCGSADAILTAPKVTGSSGSYTFASSGANKFWYTTDGTNPRYSATKQETASTATVQSPDTTRVVAVKIEGGMVTAVSPETVKAYA